MLRAFLGVTFCFAGLQKLANPGFFHASNPASIQAQLKAAARHSPIHGFVSGLEHVAVPVGLLIAFGELAVGIGVLLGLYTRIAAIGGMAISLGLFLTVSFNSNPYYTGSDIVFLFAWTPLLIAGGGPLSADAAIPNFVRRSARNEPDTIVPVAFSTVRKVCGFYEHGACGARRGAACEPGPCPFLAREAGRTGDGAPRDLERRALVARGSVAAAAAGVALFAGGVIAALGRAAGGTSNASGSHSVGTGSAATPTSATHSPATTAPSPGGGSAPPTTASSGTAIGPASGVPVGSAATFQDPRSGDPAVVVQPQAGKFIAFDAVCPHAGCTVQYDSQQQGFVCPCHGSQFNGLTGAVETGPAQSNLTPIPVHESGGQLYAD